MSGLKEYRGSFLKLLRGIAIVVPLCIYVGCLIIFPSASNGFIIPGIFGCLIVGIALALSIGILDDSFIGVFPTFLLFTIGVVLLLLSYLGLYSSVVLAMINEQVVNFYFLMWSFFLFIGFIYAFFRMGINKILRKKRISKTAIKKYMKGYRNYWWYETLHKEYDIGILYHINKFHVLIVGISLVLHFALGWCTIFTPLISIFICGSCLSSCALGWYIASKDCDMHQAYIILGVCAPLGICYVVFSYILRIL